MTVYITEPSLSLTWNVASSTTSGSSFYGTLTVRRDSVAYTVTAYNVLVEVLIPFEISILSVVSTPSGCSFSAPYLSCSQFSSGELSLVLSLSANVPFGMNLTTGALLSYSSASDSSLARKYGKPPTISVTYATPSSSATPNFLPTSSSGVYLKQVFAFNSVSTFGFCDWDEDLQNGGCFLTQQLSTSSSIPWMALDGRVINVLGYDSAAGLIYVQTRRAYMQAKLSKMNWVAVPPGVVTTAQTSSTFVAALSVASSSLTSTVAQVAPTLSNVHFGVDVSGIYASSSLPSWTKIVTWSATPSYTGNQHM